jgi:hypothetical protein
VGLADDAPALARLEAGHPARPGEQRRPGARGRLLGAATAGVLVGGALGGELVFRRGWRVVPAEEAEIVEERLRSDGLGRYVDAARAEVARFERRQTFLPAGPRGQREGEVSS